MVPAKQTPDDTVVYAHTVLMHAGCLGPHLATVQHARVPNQLTRRLARTRSGIGIVVSIKIPGPGPGKAWRGLRRGIRILESL